MYLIESPTTKTKISSSLNHWNAKYSDSSYTQIEIQISAKNVYGSIFHSSCEQIAKSALGVIIAQPYRKITVYSKIPFTFHSNQKCLMSLQAEKNGEEKRA